MRTILGAGAVAAALLAAGAANAVVIKPDLATASSQFGAGYSAANTINGSGLPSPADITAAHATYAAGNHWTTDGTDPLGEWIEWGFAAPTSIGAAYIWNHRSNGIAANGGYEPTRFDLTFFDSLNNVLASFNDLVLAPDTAVAQRIDFALIGNVSRIRFDVEAVQSTPTFTGLAEVAFNTESFVSAPIPEPAAWALMISGFGLAGSFLRRRPAPAA